MASQHFAPSRHQVVRLALVVILGLAALASAKAAEVQYTAQQRIACMPDAIRLCSNEIPDVGRVRSCMIAHKGRLSAECRAMFRS